MIFYTLMLLIPLNEKNTSKWLYISEVYSVEYKVIQSGKYDLNDVKKESTFLLDEDSDKNLFELLNLLETDEYGNTKILKWGNKPITQKVWLSLKESVIHIFKSAYNVPDKRDGDEEKDIIISEGKIPLTQKILLSSDFINETNGYLGVLFEVSPNEVTAVAAITSSGLAMFDKLGDKKGLKIYSALPFTVSTIIIPRDPKAFAKNTIRLLYDPKFAYETFKTPFENGNKVIEDFYTKVKHKPLKAMRSIIVPPPVTKISGTKINGHKISDTPKRLGKEAKRVLKKLF